MFRCRSCLDSTNKVASTQKQHPYTQLPLLSLLFRPLPVLSHSPRQRSIQSGLRSRPIPNEQLFTIQLTLIYYHHQHYYRGPPHQRPHQGQLPHGMKIWFWCFPLQQQTTKMAAFKLDIRFRSCYLPMETTLADASTSSSKLSYSSALQCECVCLRAQWSEIIMRLLPHVCP